jgi:hypothetical protein
VKKEFEFTAICPDNNIARFIAEQLENYYAFDSVDVEGNTIAATDLDVVEGALDTLDIYISHCVWKIMGGWVPCSYISRFEDGTVIHSHTFTEEDYEEFLGY